jgi:Ca2+-binding EF-hand superfamily protein
MATSTGTSSGVDDASMKKEFNMIDVDKSGFIDPGDISKLLGGFIPLQYIKQAIAAVDSNKDGKLSFEEYKKVRSKLPPIKMPAGK